MPNGGISVRGAPQLGHLEVGSFHCDARAAKHFDNAACNNTNIGSGQFLFSVDVTSLDLLDEDLRLRILEDVRLGICNLEAAMLAALVEQPVKEYEEGT